MDPTKMPLFSMRKAEVSVYVKDSLSQDLFQISRFQSETGLLLVLTCSWRSLECLFIPLTAGI